MGSKNYLNPRLKRINPSWVAEKNNLKNDTKKNISTKKAGKGAKEI